jgi:hypothetical protein
VLSKENSFSRDLRSIVGRETVIYDYELTEDTLKDLVGRSKKPLSAELYKKAYDSSVKTFHKQLSQILMNT